MCINIVYTKPCVHLSGIYMTQQSNMKKKLSKAYFVFVKKLAKTYEMVSHWATLEHYIHAFLIKTISKQQRASILC